MHKEIFRLIKKYDSIVISRHVGADIDALGSQLGLKKVIENTFPNKKVYAVGAYSSIFIASPLWVLIKEKKNKHNAAKVT